MTTVEILRAARELISDPARWTRGKYGATATGNHVRGDDPQAIRWCAYGAIEKVVGNSSWDAEMILSEAAHPHVVIHINDELGHAAVLDLYDRAIALAEQEEAAK